MAIPVESLSWLEQELQGGLIRLKSIGMDKVITYFLLCLVLFSISGCNAAKQRRINEKANEVYQGLYVPIDAVLLGKVEHDRLLAYAHGCVGTVIEVAYGANRPLGEIIDGYHQALLESGWELDPGYYPNKTETDAFYQRDPMTEIHIIPEPIGVSIPELGEETFTTVYEVMILYTEPSNSDRIG